MLPALLNLVYLSLLIAAAPLLVYRRLVLGKDREGWGHKFFGRLPERSTDRPVVWFHAVSVGEVLLLRPILQRLRSERPDCHVVISTTTQTGQAVAQDKYPDCETVYFPLDFSWSVRRALRRVRPDLMVMVELELWPNFLLAAERAGVPVVLVNGRLSEKSFRGYRKLKPLLGRLLRSFRRIAVQSETYAQRFRDLGAAPEQVCVTGSVKFDQVTTDRDQPATRELRKFFGLREDETVLISGSTQAPEERFALDAYQTLRNEFPGLRLILVPRHQERFEEVAELLQGRGVPLVRRSQGIPAEPAGPPSSAGNSAEPPVLLLDTLGELGACWGLADIAYVGGSLTNRGGQNMIEPAAYGAAVLFGPNTQNFRDVVLLLLGEQAACVVHSAEELTGTVRSLLRNPAEAREMGSAARRLVLTQQGATRATVDLLLDSLPAPHEAFTTGVSDGQTADAAAGGTIRSEAA